MVKKKKNPNRYVFHTIKDITNTKFTGDKTDDTNILDGIMDFIYKPNTTEKDRVKAAKHMAVYFGDDPEDITKDYVDNLMKEYASTEKELAAQVTSSKQWFGAKDHTSQIFDKSTLDNLVKKYNADIDKDFKKQQKNNIEYALAILKEIEKRSGFKTTVLQKTKGGLGRVSIQFRVEGFVGIDTYSNNHITIANNENGTYTIYVGG